VNNPPLTDYTPTQIRQNLLFNCTHEFSWGFGVAFHSTYALIPLFLAELGAPSAIIASLAGVFSILMAVPQLVSAGLSRNAPNRKLTVIGFHLLIWPSAFFMAFIFTVLAPTGESAWIAYYACFVLYGLSIGLVIPVWSGFIHASTNRSSRGRFIGVSFAMNSLGGFLGGLLVKRIFNGTIPFPLNFGVGFWILFGAIIVGTLVFLGFHVNPDKQVRPTRTLKEVWSEIRQIIRTHTHFRRYILTRIFITANFPAISLYAVFAQERFHFAISEAGVFTMIQVFAFGLASFGAGAIGDRWGHKSALILAVVSYLAAVVVSLNAVSMTRVYLIFVFLGIGQGAFLPASMNMAYEFAGTRDIRIYIALVESFLAPFTVIAILLAGVFVSRVSYETLFAAIGVSLFVGLSLLVFWVSDPRKTEHQPELTLPV